MRHDSVGFFWEDEAILTKSGKSIIRTMPAIPETGWEKPNKFPDLTNANVISLDVETYDPDLIKFGPGWARGVGHIVGVSIAISPRHKWYFPMRHEVMPEDNLPHEQVISWLKNTFNNKIKIIVGANLLYDIGWLRQEGVLIGGVLHDVQFAEALLSEGESISLEAISQKYLREGKETDIVYEWCSDYYGGAINERQRKNLYRAPPKLVGPYAISDVDLPLRVMPILKKELFKRGLENVYRMECDSIPMLIDMRFKGVYVNVDKAEQAYDKMNKLENKLHERLKNNVGFEVNVNAAASLVKMFDKLGLSYGTTSKGNPSFTKQVLKGHHNINVKIVQRIKELRKIRDTFLKSYILESSIESKIYTTFHPLRGEGGGTRSGRLSSSKPNLQNIPVRTAEGKIIRELFEPDYGHVCWRSYDFSQIEYRLLVEDAVGSGADKARNMFMENPNLDYHDFVMQLLAPFMGWDLNNKEKTSELRRPVKNVNFGLIYGMGIKALCEQLGLELAEGKKFIKKYKEAIAYADPTMEYYSKMAQLKGYITTITGRRSYFDTWEPIGYKKIIRPLPLNLAMKYWPNEQLMRAKTYKALNRRLQGSAADVMKLGMLQCYNDGIFDDIGVPRLTVHDELNFSDDGTGSKSGWKEFVHIMETCAKTQVPLRLDYSKGANWAEAK